jgi:glycosyltransferase involved in cell wall biosynthesis
MRGTLGFITPVRAYLADDGISMQAASGRVVEQLAKHFERVYTCARVVHGNPPAPFDFPLDTQNLELIAQPFWNTTADSLVHFWGIAKAYVRTCRQSDALFIRGMCPYTPVLYLCAALFRKPVCHWIVGNPVALLRASARNGAIRDRFALFYARLDRLATRVGRWLARGTFVCNGRELARIYASPRTVEVVSSTIDESEFFHRTDTCRGRTIRILCVSFIRPEKGIEYLLDAVRALPNDVPWELEIVGPNEFPAYRQKLDAIAARPGLTGRVHWKGYVPYGQPLFERMRAADIFVLPTLSEGTPHVLVEARANGLPCISTRVGGVPTTVTDRVDALLVEPKKSLALAEAIERVIRDAELRRTLIRNGLAEARKQTLGRFITIVLGQLDAGARRPGVAVPQE